MQTNNGQIEVTLRGQNLAEIASQARQLVSEVDEAGGKAALQTEVGKRRGRKAAALATVEETPTIDDSFIDSDDAAEMETETETETDFMEAAPAPATKGKGKKLTDKDVNEACMKHARTHGRPATLKILKQKFGVESILELNEDQYAKVLAALKV